jgi:hypothetical protein
MRVLDIDEVQGKVLWDWASLGGKQFVILLVVMGFSLEGANESH